MISATPTLPALPVSQFGDTLLAHLEPQLVAVLPYAAAFTAFAIGISFLVHWIGRKSALGVAYDKWGAMERGPTRTRYGNVYTGRSGRIYTEKDYQ